MAELAGIEGARERGRTRGWVLSALRPHTKAVSAALALTLLASLLAVAQPVALKRLVEALGASGRALGPLGLLVGVTLAEATCRGLVVYLVQSTSEHVTRDLRIDLVRHVLRLPIRRLDAARRGDLVTRLTADSAQVRLVLTSGLLEMTSATMLIIGSVIVMTLLDTVLAGVTMGAIVLVVVILTPVAGKLRKANSHYQESLGSLGGGLDTVLSSIRLLRSYSAERSQGDVLAQAAQTTWRHGLRVARLAALIEPVVAVATQGALLTVLVVGGARVSRGQLTLGDLVAFLLYLFMVLLPLAQLVNALARLQAGLAALARIGQIVDTPLEPNPGAGTPATRWETPVVELEGVSFEYEPGIGVFDLSFAANKGTHTAIVGPSGAGKSTVLGLIQQFYPVHQGHLRFNGTPADTTDVMHCRGLTHFVEQNTRPWRPPSATTSCWPTRTRPKHTCARQCVASVWVTCWCATGCWTAPSAITASPSAGASVNDWRGRDCSSPSATWFSWTNLRPMSTPPTKPSSAGSCANCPTAMQSSPSHTAYRQSARPTKSSCSTLDASWERELTKSWPALAGCIKSSSATSPEGALSRGPRSRGRAERCARGWEG